MNRHPFRWGSLVFGVLFAVLAAGWATHEYDLLDADTAGIVAAGTLIVLGVVGVVSTVVLSRRPPRVPGSPDDHADGRLETEEVDDDQQEAHPQR